jgi:hypothetical protein
MSLPAQYKHEMACSPRRPADGQMYQARIEPFLLKIEKATHSTFHFFCLFCYKYSLDQQRHILHGTFSIVTRTIDCLHQSETMGRQRGYPMFTRKDFHGGQGSLGLFTTEKTDQDVNHLKNNNDDEYCQNHHSRIRLISLGHMCNGRFQGWKRAGYECGRNSRCRTWLDCRI